MIFETFDIGNKDWFFEVYLDVGKDDMAAIYDGLRYAGCPIDSVVDACEVLTGYNKGYTFTNFRKHLTLIYVSRATSSEQMYDSIMHEVRHATDHIGEYYNVHPRGEEIAYLQGEIARQLFPAAAMVTCSR